ncbi:ORF6N domain-containing protein [Algoriphagus aquimarinus]|uniref:ORF6N domain-containing protein n=1 Tax=Algoriphagus aquimarinus TaxID=237018 RepID=A0A5C7ARK6_9BACT|nr:ORF6N domain-containing protein [Algoriphagus aquimarinus]TXE11396.1 ORF6N domain-containing protein [Algoriphagus aquimarinus]
MSKDLLLSNQEIENRIFTIRGLQVMIDRDLAELYKVETRALNQAVKRNLNRFPNSFRFQLNDEEFENWRSQTVISNNDKMGLRRPPFVFTEQGVAK